MNLNRRDFLLTTSGLLLAPTMGRTQEQAIPLSLPKNAKYASYDTAVIQAMQEYNIPGCAISVLHAGQLVYKQGYGYADLASRQGVTNKSLFRIASLSKFITGMAIHLLIQDGAISLDTCVYDYLKLEPFKVVTPFDERIKKITIRHLLHMRSGMNPGCGEIPQREWKAQGLTIPYSQQDAVRWAFAQSLDSEPGQTFAYNNGGFVVLGEVVRKASKTSYLDFVNTRICAPLRVEPFKEAKWRQEERLRGEVAYYERRQIPGPSLYPEDHGKIVDPPYGAYAAFHLPAAGGLVCNLDTLTAIVSYLGRPSLAGKPILSNASFARMMEKPVAGPVNDGGEPNQFYSCGLYFNMDGNGRVAGIWHGGSLQGAASAISWNIAGYCLVVMANANAVGGDQHYGFKVVGKMREAEKQLR